MLPLIECDVQLVILINVPFNVTMPFPHIITFFTLEYVGVGRLFKLKQEEIVPKLTLNLYHVSDIKVF